MSVGCLGRTLISQHYRDFGWGRMKNVLFHSSPDYRCRNPGCSYIGIKIIKMEKFTPERPDESDKREDISTVSGERNEIEPEERKVEEQRK